MKKTITIILSALLILNSNLLFAGKSYSSGGSSRSSSSSSSSSRSSSSGGKSYSGGGSKSSSSSKPSNTTYGAKLSQSGQKQESKNIYDSTTKVKTSTGKTMEIKRNSPIVVVTKQYVTPQRYSTYSNRSTSFYGGYQPQPYNDFFSPFIMGYLFSSVVNSNDRAQWAYHHKDEMDSARYKAMLEKDAELNARVKELEKQNVKRDPSYVVPGMVDNPDLQYSEEFVNAAYNMDNDSWVGTFFMWIFYILVFGIAVFGLFYLFCIKEF